MLADKQCSAVWLYLLINTDKEQTNSLIIASYWLSKISVCDRNSSPFKNPWFDWIARIEKLTENYTSIVYHESCHKIPFLLENGSLYLPTFPKNPVPHTAHKFHMNQLIALFYVLLPQVECYVDICTIYALSLIH